MESNLLQTSHLAGTCWLHLWYFTEHLIQQKKANSRLNFCIHKTATTSKVSGSIKPILCCILQPGAALLHILWHKWRECFRLWFHRNFLAQTPYFLAICSWLCHPLSSYPASVHGSSSLCGNTSHWVGILARGGPGWGETTDWPVQLRLVLSRKMLVSRKWFM